ncbi:hypothetical protein SAMN05428974_0533 [Sphingopyxis sp. YR583]|uniref:hypothetical protein n=1 Tax=Sphingopyxis sp. YR583 TaxID=1881047 RepID=UPI0008A7C759|nr:hypothetical protein [Sphingopyxis sp. YR583]SEH12668.1 hypothetical protein SAMN05428974_0533 [Sphingopyxis sp. YR583]
MAELRDRNVSTVLLGRFNPLIFSPDWLAANNVIGPVEAKEASQDGIEIMSPTVTSIKLGSMKLLVEEQRFMLVVGDEPFVRAKDFPATCFAVLRHTPVHAIGINYNEMLVGNDEASWHRLGDRLAPKEPWGDFVPHDDGAERRGGLRSVVMERRGGGGGDDRWSYTRVSFEIQDQALHGLINVNNHFRLGDAAHPQSGAEAYHLVNDLWDRVMDHSRALVHQMRDLADAV